LTQDNPCDLPMTQAELGDTLGLSVVHTNRTVQGLRAEGLIHLQGKSLKVLDLTGLQDLAMFNPNYLHFIASSPTRPRTTSPAPTVVNVVRRSRSWVHPRPQASEREPTAASVNRENCPLPCSRHAAASAAARGFARCAALSRAPKRCRSTPPMHGRAILEDRPRHEALVKLAEPQHVWPSLFLPVAFEPAKNTLSDCLRASPPVQPSAHDLVMPLDLRKRGEFDLDGWFEMVRQRRRRGGLYRRELGHKGLPVRPGTHAARSANQPAK